MGRLPASSAKFNEHHSKRKVQQKRELTKQQRKTLQQYLVASLYTLIPPRRLDYSNMKIVSYREYRKMPSDELKASNYLVVQSRVKKYFSFGENSQKNKQNFVMRVPPKLNQILNLYLKHHSATDYLLLNSRNIKQGTWRNYFTNIKNLYRSSKTMVNIKIINFYKIKMKSKSI